MKFILVVDDNPKIRKVFSDGLKEYDLTLCDSGQSAIDICKANQFDLVITDINMPSISGIDVIKAIKPSGTKIIAMSGSPKSIIHKIEKQAMEAGADYFVRKPYFSKEPLKLDDILLIMEKMK